MHPQGQQFAYQACQGIMGCTVSVCGCFPASTAAAVMQPRRQQLCAVGVSCSALWFVHRCCDLWFVHRCCDMYVVCTTAVTFGLWFAPLLDLCNREAEVYSPAVQGLQHCLWGKCVVLLQNSCSVFPGSPYALVDITAHRLLLVHVPFPCQNAHCLQPLYCRCAVTRVWCQPCDCHHPCTPTTDL
jgi:hypothetical protein